MDRQIRSVFPAIPQTLAAVLGNGGVAWIICARLLGRAATRRASRASVSVRGRKVRLFSYPDQYRGAVKHWTEDWWRFSCSIPGSNFTTITVNWNTVFRAHKDANNSSGALSCLAAFGNYRLGELVFPRLDVAFSVKECDMLVCDCPRELHATVPPLGTRFSLAPCWETNRTFLSLKSISDHFRQATSPSQPPEPRKN